MVEIVWESFRFGGFPAYGLGALFVLSCLWCLALLGSEVVARSKWEWEPPLSPEVLWALAPFVISTAGLLAIGLAGHSSLQDLATVDTIPYEDESTISMMAAYSVSGFAVLAGLSIAIVGALACLGLGITSILRGWGSGQTDWVTSILILPLALSAALSLFLVNEIFFYGPRASHVSIALAALIVAGVGCSLLAFRRRVEESPNGELSQRLAGAMTAFICLGGASLATYGFKGEAANTNLILDAPDRRDETAEFVAQFFGELHLLIAMAMAVLLLICAMMIGRGLKAGWDRRATITVTTCLFLSVPLLGATGFAAKQLLQIKEEYRTHVIEWEPPPLEEMEDSLEGAEHRPVKVPEHNESLHDSAPT